MFDRAPQDNELRRVMDACLPGLENRPDFDRDVLRQVRGEVKVKKKLSVGFVLVIVLVLAAVTALAAALLWEQQVVPMKEIEQAEGDYVNWSISQKQALIRALIDSGNIEETAETARLFDDSTGETEKQAIANQLVLTLTGQTDVKEINVDIITYAIMGSTDKWTLEQRVWWQQVTNQFRNSGDDPDILITPNGKEPTETEAIAIAKAAILSAYELPSDALDNAQAVANLYVTDQRPDYRRWDVQFKVFRDGSDSYTERIYVAIVDEQGKIIADPDVSMPSVNDMAAIYKNMKSNDGNSVADMYMQYMKQAGNKIFQLWSLEEKAEFSRNVAPLVRAAVESGDLSQLNIGGEPDIDVVALSSYSYGLPQEQDIPQADAYTIAKQALVDAYQLDDETIALYDNPYFYFDTTNPNVTLWKIVFWPSYSSAEKFPDGFASGQGHLRYKVELNSCTGEITKTEVFEFEALGGDIDYKLKLY